MKIIGIQSLKRGPKANAWARSGQALTFSPCNRKDGKDIENAIIDTQSPKSEVL